MDEKINPPITACPKGATCSPPSPKPDAIGIIPAIMAIVVIKIGLIREGDAQLAAGAAEILKSLRQSPARFTIDTAFEADTPIDAKLPVCDYTFRVLPNIRQRS